tara:strand:- start:633 stop:1499 length:867 start_codon:yes stop_codon:yes gene_type:complete
MKKTKVSNLALELSGLKEKEISELLKHAKNASIIGGDILMKYYGNISDVNNKGRIGDLVTNADLEAEKNIINYLNNVTPDVSILAEESGIKGSETSLMWCIDPLDGTTNFAHGYPFFATSIGLCFNNIPLLGSINIPYLKEIYYSAPIIGAFCNEEIIEVSSTNKLIDSLLVTGFAYDRRSVIDNNYAEFCWLTHKTRGVRRGGSAATDLAYIASGKLDGYWERGLSKWDLAAGVPLVEQAGGIISSYKYGDFDLSEGRILACTPGIEKEIKQELRKVEPLDKKYFDD